MVEESKTSLHGVDSNTQFKVEPKDVLNTRIKDLLGNKFIMKKGQTEREKEETNLTEDCTADEFEGTKFVGLFFAADWSPPCKAMLKPLKNFYTDANLEQRTFEIVFVTSDRTEEQWR